MRDIHCVIMAGGIGSRFWPLSRPEKPKQFLDILGSGSTLLQQTQKRLACTYPEAHHYVVTGESYQEQVLQQLPMLSPSDILSEPMRRNTAPCIAYAAYKIFSRDPEGLMVVSPADHYVGDTDAFVATMRRAADYATEHPVLMTIGIKPTYPAIGYGYIEQSTEARKAGIGPVLRFKEKPSLEEAKQLLSTGNNLWNGGIFIWQVREIIQAFETHLPEVARIFASCSSYNDSEEQAEIAKLYPALPSISIDYGIMEHASNVFVATGDFKWNDIGSWGSLDRQLLALAPAPNPLHQTVNSTRLLIRTDDPTKRVIVAGLDDYLIVDTDDVLLIAPKSNEAALQALITSQSEKS